MEEQEIKKTTPSKCEVIGSFIAMRVVGSWFEILATLAVKTLNGLEELISRKC